LSLKLSKPKPNLYKRKAPNTNPKNSSLIPSFLLVIAEKKLKRTLKLVEQQAIRLDKIVQAGDFKRQLADKYICKDKGCTN